MTHMRLCFVCGTSFCSSFCSLFYWKIFLLHVFFYLLDCFNRCLILRLLCSVTELVSLNASMSKNVFLESLNNMKEFHSNLYISNNKQELGFVWFRPESGMYLGNILPACTYAKSKVTQNVKLHAKICYHLWNNWFYLKKKSKYKSENWCCHGFIY